MNIMELKSTQLKHVNCPYCMEERYGNANTIKKHMETDIDNLLLQQEYTDYKFIQQRKKHYKDILKHIKFVWLL